MTIPFQAEEVHLGVSLSGIPRAYSAAKSGTTDQLWD